uniref:(northern house mosquito) hypothetical protein n=1 Tax=Culex pipiens TaxID=7175 RepID=A0A8D8CWZ8_CULPI
MQRTFTSMYSLARLSSQQEYTIDELNWGSSASTVLSRRYFCSRLEPSRRHRQTCGFLTIPSFRSPLKMCRLRKPNLSGKLLSGVTTLRCSGTGFGEATAEVVGSALIIVATDVWPPSCSAFLGVCLTFLAAGGFTASGSL